jgi:phenylalanyl-tRNA synthetase alpha chain
MVDTHATVEEQLQ